MSLTDDFCCPSLEMILGLCWCPLTAVVWLFLWKKRQELGIYINGWPCRLLCSQIKCPWCSHPMLSILSPPSSLTATSTFLQDHTRHTSHQMSTPNKVRALAFSGKEEPCLISQSDLIGAFALCHWVDRNKFVGETRVIYLLAVFYKPSRICCCFFYFSGLKKKKSIDYFWNDSSENLGSTVQTSMLYKYTKNSILGNPCGHSFISAWTRCWC